MRQLRCLFFLALTLPVAPAWSQGILGTINAPDKAVPGTSEAILGTWLLELRRPGQTTLPPTLNLVTFLQTGLVIASSADGAQTSGQGLWMRVGYNKFLQTMFVFNFNAERALTTITKVRINAQLSADGNSLSGTTEVVVMNRDGVVTATIPGGTYSGVRLSPEIPGDFYEFQKRP
jgi:hypothetical protein